MPISNASRYSNARSRLRVCRTTAGVSSVAWLSGGAGGIGVRKARVAEALFDRQALSHWGCQREVRQFRHFVNEEQPGSADAHLVAGHQFRLLIDPLRVDAGAVQAVEVWRRYQRPAVR